MYNIILFLTQIIEEIYYKGKACNSHIMRSAYKVGGNSKKKNAMFSLILRPKKISKQEHYRDILLIIR